MQLILLVILLAQVDLAPKVDFSWPQIALWGPTLILIAMVFVFLLKLRPSIERLKMRELDVREIESKARSEQAASQALQANALGQLGDGLTKMSETLQEIAVEQRRATEAVKILQRVNADTSDQTHRHLAILTDRVERLERGQNVEPEGSGTRPY